MEETFVKYPIGVQDFEKLISEGYLYVDKTALIYKMANTGNCYFLSHTRTLREGLMV